VVSGFRGIITKVLPVFLLVSCAAGCFLLPKKSDELFNDQFFFERGKKYMDKKDYLKAVTDFETVVESFSASEIVDHAQFMLGEAYFKSEEYVTAAYEYERVYIDYPSSSFAPEAHYKKALCYYMESPSAILDQENTRLAVEEFNRFIDNYPSHPLVEESQKKIEELTAKLAYKEYLNAETYKKLWKQYDGALESALYYYRYIIKKYPRTIWADYSRYGIGEVHFKKKEYEKAKEMFLLVVNADVDAELKEKASKMLDEIEKIETR